MLAEAIAVASPSLSRMLGTGGAGARAAQVRRAALAVLRYDIRMRTRPTPFGLFAGVAAGRFGAEARLDWDGGHRTRTRVDLGWLLGVVRELEADLGVVASLTVRAHPLVTRRGDRVAVQREGSTVSVRHTPVVELVLAMAAETVAVAELVARVAARFDAEPKRVLGLVGTLVAQDILITSLRPPLDGGDPLRHVMAATPLHAVPLRLVAEACERYDALPIGAGRVEFDALLAATRRVREHSAPVQVDTAVEGEFVLPEEVRAEAERAVELLWRLSPSELGVPRLRAYHTRFLERYGVDRLVGVVELVDEVRGLGSLSDRVEPPAPAAALWRLAAEALRDGRREVELTDDILAELTGEGDPGDAPISCELIFHVLADSPTALADGEFQLLLAANPGSRCAGAAFTRFADLLPEDVRAAVAEQMAAVPLPVRDALRVDLAFAPHAAGAGNLTPTTAIGGVRIAVGLPGSVDTEEIPLSDIAIGATRERLCAVHLPTGREIVPMLTSVINTETQAPEVVRLLQDIGFEGQRLWQPWRWGSLSALPFLPRIRRGRIVLAPARWRLDALRNVAEAGFDAAVDHWRRDWRVPERVHAVSRDQRLLLDLTDPWHREILRHEVGKDPDLVAQEVSDGQAMEFVVPFTRVERVSRQDRAPRWDPCRARPAVGVWPGGLGGDWLCLVLQLPAHRQDALLRDHLPALVARAGAHGVDRWFFVRYSDVDGPHLRVRFHGDPALLWADAALDVGAMVSRWERDGLIRSHRVERYDPEFERYGGVVALAVAESVFEADSNAALDLLRIADRHMPLDDLAVVSVALLTVAFGAELPATKWPSATRSDAQRWRRLLNPADEWAGLRHTRSGAEILAALAPRDAAAKKLRAEAGHALSSLIHMTCNRLFPYDADREATVIATAHAAVSSRVVGVRRRELG